MRLYRDGLTQALSRQPHIEIVAAVADPADAFAFVREQRPDVVLLDGSTPDGLSLAAALAADAMTVIAFGIPDDDQAVLACAEAGVKGYVTATASISDLLAAVASVARGEVLCSPRTAAALFERVARLHAGHQAPPPDTVLTAREREIVDLVAQGLSNKTIAVRLGIALATVKNHVHHVLEKLALDRRGQIAHCLRQGALRVWHVGSAQRM